MLIYRVENSAGNGPFTRAPGEGIKKLSIDYVMLQTGIWGMGNKDWGKIFDGKLYQTLTPDWKLGCDSLDSLRLWFPCEHESLQDFHINVYECEDYKRTEFEVAFNLEKATKVRSHCMEDMFAAITPAHRNSMQMRKAEFARDPAGRMRALLGI